MLVKKKDGSTRPCVDYHRLNAVTHNDAYPVPRAQDCLDSMAGSGMFSTMDVLSAYNQVPMTEENIPKTAFSTKYGLFEFTTMPFGLMTAPATYQQLMELALSGLQWSLRLIYLDDVIVFSEDFDEQVDRLDQVLTCIGSRAPLGEMLVGAPLDRLATDILGPFPESTKGNRYILAVTDYFTKWVEIYTIPDQSAVTCAEVILDEFIGQYGCPYNIHSDQGRNYESTVFTELCRLLEIQKTWTSPYNPPCNGQVERFNQTLVSMIKSFVKGKQREWDRNLGSLAGAYHATVHESTGMTPNLLMFGKENQLPIEVILGTGKTSMGEEITSYGEYVDGLRDHIQKVHDVARKYLGKML